MIVIDASVLAAFILKEPGWRNLVKYVKNAVSVDLVFKEVANVIWKACRIRKIVDEDQARRLYSILESMRDKNIFLESEDRYLGDALEIALENEITVYDALYIALAARRKLPLATLDKRQEEVAARLGVKVIRVGV